MAPDTGLIAVTSDPTTSSHAIGGLSLMLAHGRRAATTFRVSVSAIASLVAFVVRHAAVSASRAIAT